MVAGPGEQSACVQAEAREPVGAGELRSRRDTSGTVGTVTTSSTRLWVLWSTATDPNEDTLTYTLGGADMRIVLKSGRKTVRSR